MFAREGVELSGYISADERRAKRERDMPYEMIQLIYAALDQHMRDFTVSPGATRSDRSRTSVRAPTLSESRSVWSRSPLTGGLHCGASPLNP